MTARGDDRKLMDYIARRGYRVVKAYGGHWKVYAGERLLTSTSGTPSDWRSRRNFLHQLRRRSYELG